MDNMILKRLVASILALSLATNGNISLASSPGEDIPAPNKGEERDEEKKEGTAEVKEEKEAKEEERKEDEKPQEEKKEDNEEIKRDEKKVDIGGEETEEEKDEEKIKGKLAAMLLDSSKQDRIEEHIIEELKKVNGSKKLNDVFATALSACAKIRKNPVYRSEAIAADERDPRFLHILAKECAIIAWRCRDMLYNLEDKQIALDVIQKLSNLENEYGPQYREFFKRLNQIFYHSRRLLAVTIAPQIIKQYINDNMGEETAFQIVAFEEIKGGDGPANHICRFTIDKNNYVCEFSRKPVGVFFGSIVTIRANNGSLLKRYYLKAHEGYPAINKKESKESYKDTTTQLRTSIDTPDKPTTTFGTLDLREPFVYKVLEILGYGPRAHFFVNPYINYGLYIVTEDLNSEPNVFKELKDIGESVENADVVFNVSSESKIKQSVESGLNELSVLTNIFQLKDIKGDNIGFVGTKEIWDKLVHEEDNDNDEEEEEECEEEQENQFLRPLIIDFLNETTDESPTINRDAQRYSLSQGLIDGEMFRSYSANTPYSSLIMPHEKLYTNIYGASEDAKLWSSNVAGVYAQNARKLKQVTDEFLPKKQKAWHILNEIIAEKGTFKKLLEFGRGLVISTAEKILQPTNPSSSVNTLQQRIEQLDIYCSLLETNYEITEELLTADESSAEPCRLAAEVNEMCEAVQKKAEEQISKAKAKAKSKAKPKNTGVSKTQSGVSAGLKQFIAAQRAKKEDPQ